ncbi:hypothetical protein WDU94_011517 [Cyamophila willieti]
MDTYLSILETKAPDPNLYLINKSFFSPTFLTGFIKKYQSLTCLWNVKSPDYSNNAARQNSWEELTDYCRTLFPNADMMWVKKKVQNMRGSIRKELRKINNKRTGDGYKPKLWYFDLLSFVKDVEASQGESDGEDEDPFPPNVGCIQTLHDTYPDTSFQLLQSGKVKRRDSESSTDSAAMFFTMFSQRGHKLIVVDGFKFRKDRDTHLGRKWRCTVSTCNAQIVTNHENDDEVVQKMGEHNHEVSKKLPREFISNNLKQRHGKKEDIALEILSAPPDLRCQITSADISRAKRNLTPRNRSKKLATNFSGLVPPHASLCETILTSDSDSEREMEEDWPKEKSLSLINSYQEHECLYKTNSKNYKNTIKKRYALHALATEFTVSVEVLEKKLKSLLAAYRREKKKEAESDVYRSKWFAFKAMDFLKDYNKPRKTRESGL